MDDPNKVLYKLDDEEYSLETINELNDFLTACDQQLRKFKYKNTSDEGSLLKYLKSTHSSFLSPFLSTAENYFHGAENYATSIAGEDFGRKYTAVEGKAFFMLNDLRDACDKLKREGRVLNEVSNG